MQQRNDTGLFGKEKIKIWANIFIIFKITSPKLAKNIRKNSKKRNYLEIYRKLNAEKGE